MNVSVFFERLVSDIVTHPVMSLALLLLAVLIIIIAFLSERVSRFTRGNDGKSLEQLMHGLSTRVEKLEAHAAKAETGLNNVDNRLKRSLQGVSVKHFDPFQGAGGQQSFSVALINEQGDGAVISGIHARDGVRVYTKPVAHFTSERELSEEERTAIEDAKQKLN